MKPSFFILATILLISSCTPKQQIVTGSYAGSILPGDSALLFSPGFVNTGMYTRDLCITPDGNEIYFTIMIGDFSHSHILVTKQIDGKWTMPELADFASNPNYKYYEPFISPDGKKFFFASNQAAETEGSETNEDIWVMNREGDKWGQPSKLPAVINSKFPEFYPSVAINGNLYFTREDMDGNFIYMSKYENGEYLEPVKMPAEINGGRARYNAVISANDSMMIVPVFGLPDSFGATDHYISFKNEKGDWSTLINLGPQINSNSRNEYSANWSPDGKYLFFMSSKVKKVDLPIIRFADLQEIYLRPENGKSNIYWIKSDFISALKEKAVYPKTK